MGSYRPGTGERRLQPNGCERGAVDGHLIPGDSRAAVRSGPRDRSVRSEWDARRVRHKGGRSRIDIDRRGLRGLRISLAVRGQVFQDVTTVAQDDRHRVGGPRVPVEAIRDGYGASTPARGRDRDGHRGHVPTGRPGRPRRGEGADRERMEVTGDPDRLASDGLRVPRDIRGEVVEQMRAVPADGEGGAVRPPRATIDSVLL